MSVELRFPNINSVTISGRLVRDVEIRYTANNVSIASLCIAMDKPKRDEKGNFIKDEEGRTVSDTSFIDIVAFGYNAQKCQENLKKGSPVIVQGEIRSRTYVDKNTNMNRKVTEVIVEKIYPLDKNKNISDFNSQTQSSGYNASSYTNKKQPDYPEYDYDQPNNTPSTTFNPPPVYDETEDDVPF